MSESKTGGTAFPLHSEIRLFDNEWCCMDLRDYFAAKALPAIYTTAMQDAREGSGLLQYDDWRTGLAIDAYAMADAMLKARGKA